MASNTSIDSVNSEVFFVEQISKEPSPQRNNSPNIMNSPEASQTHTAGTPSVSSIASRESQLLTVNDDSNEPTMTYGLGRQLPIVPPSLNDLKLPPNPFNILATMVAVHHTEDGNEDNYSTQSPEPSEPSPISTPKGMSALSIAGRRLTRRPMTTRFIPLTSLGEFIFSHQTQHHRCRLRAR